ncbi:hypothetical protein FI667_g10519, partial [Globisporangium splendens]
MQSPWRQFVNQLSVQRQRWNRNNQRRQENSASMERMSATMQRQTIITKANDESTIDIALELERENDKLKRDVAELETEVERLREVVATRSTQIQDLVATVHRLIRTRLRSTPSSRSGGQFDVARRCLHHASLSLSEQSEESSVFDWADSDDEEDEDMTPIWLNRLGRGVSSASTADTDDSAIDEQDDIAIVPVTPIERRDLGTQLLARNLV